MTSALQLIRAHSWFVYLYLCLTILMMMCDLRSPAHQSTFLVAKPQTDASHTSRLSPPRLAMICHSPDQANVSPYPTIQLSNCTTIQATDQICHSPYPTYPTSHISSLTRSLYNYKYKYYRWGCLLGRLRSCTPSPCLSRGVLGHGGGVLELNAMLTSREASTPKG